MEKILEIFGHNPNINGREDKRKYRREDVRSSGEILLQKITFKSKVRYKHPQIIIKPPPHSGNVLHYKWSPNIYIITGP